VIEKVKSLKGKGKDKGEDKGQAKEE